MPVSATRVHRSLFASQQRRLAIGISVSAVCLFLAFRDVQPGRLLSAFAAVNRAWLAVALLWVAPAFGATAQRWSLLLRPAGRVPFPRSARLLAIGYLLKAR